MVIKVTTIPAINTPVNMAAKDFLNGMPNKNAAAVPVQAPVIGNGMATNRTSVIKVPYFAALEVNLFLVLANIQVKNLLKNVDLSISHFETGSNNHNNSMAGIKLPITAHKYEDQTGISKPTNATGIAALNSAIGNIAINKVANSGEKF